MMPTCNFCFMGEMLKQASKPGRRETLWLCEECGHFETIGPIDHVVIGHPNTVTCRACGYSYEWSTPVPIRLFVGGNLAFTYEHRHCKKDLDEARNELLAVLITRFFKLQGYE